MSLSAMGGEPSAVYGMLLPPDEREVHPIPEIDHVILAEGGLEYVELYRSARFALMLRRLRRSHRVVAAAAENGQSIAACE